MVRDVAFRRQRVVSASLRVGVSAEEGGCESVHVLDE